MWTEEQRRIYRREGDGYPSDLRDTECAQLAPLILPARPDRRLRRTDMPVAINVILYLLRTGCRWRYLPRDSFPPCSAVYNISRKFERDGVWEAIWAVLHMASRDGPRGPRLGGGSRQSVDQIGRKRGSNDGQVGYEAGRQVKGRKIHALVDSEGLPMRAVVHSAAIQDRDGAGLVLDKNPPPLPLAQTDLG
jgi:putative transposase